MLDQIRSLLVRSVLLRNVGPSPVSRPLREEISRAEMSNVIGKTRTDVDCALLCRTALAIFLQNFRGTGTGTSPRASTDTSQPAFLHEPVDLVSTHSSPLFPHTPMCERRCAVLTKNVCQTVLPTQNSSSCSSAVPLLVLEQLASLKSL